MVEDVRCVWSHPWDHTHHYVVSNETDTQTSLSPGERGVVQDARMPTSRTRVL